MVVWYVVWLAGVEWYLTPTRFLDPSAVACHVDTSAESASHGKMAPNAVSQRKEGRKPHIKALHTLSRYQSLSVY